MRAEAGVGMWSPDAKQLIETRVSLPADHVLVVEGSSRLVSKRGPKSTQTTVTTQFAVGSSDGVRLEVRPAEGDWRAVDFVGRDPVELEGVSTYRVRLPARDWWLVDDYQHVVPERVAFAHDARRGLLVVTVVQPPVATGADARRYLLRRISFESVE